VGLSSLQFVPFGWVSIILIGLIGLIAIGRLYLGSLRDKPVRIRRRYIVLLVYLLISAVAVIFAGKHTIFHHGIIMLPLAGILAGYFQENKRNTVSEVIFTILLLLVVVGKLARLD
jgi:membrane-associated HD superfamily phosphohydrolase